MAQYIFGGSTGETPETIARKREFAAALLGQPTGRISTIGQGIGAALGSFADGMQSRRLLDEASAAESAGRSSANSAFEQFRAALTGGSAAPDTAAMPGAGGLDPNNPVYSNFMSTVQQAGVTNPYALAAIASTGHAESRFDPANANRTWSDPSVSGKPGTAGGVMSWRGDRLNNLYQFAAQRGEEPGSISPQTQAEFFLSEDPSLIQSLQQAKSASEAQALMNNAWRFANYDKPGGEAARRTSFAQGLVPSFQGDQETLPQNARPAAGLPASGSAPPAASPGMSLADMAQIAANPWLPKGQRAVVEQYIKQQMEAQDPARALQMQKMQLEVDALRSPQAKPTDTQRNLEWRAREAGLTPGTPEYSAFMRSGGSGPQTVVNMGEGDKFYENLDKKNAETFASLSEGGMNARARIAQLDQLDTLLKQSPAGAEAGLKLWLGDWGLKTDGVDVLQATRALVEKMVPEQRKPGSGPMSDADIVMYRRSLPTVLNQPGGNALIIGTAKAIAEYDMQMGAIADAVADREITPAEGRRRIRELKNPLEDYRKRVEELGPAAPQPASPAAPAAPDADGWSVLNGVKVREKR